MNRQPWTTAFEEYAKKLVNPRALPGAMLALAKDGEIFYQKAFGHSDAEQQKEVTLDTVFGIGSITKSFSCIAILQLQEAGKLCVQDPVITYLPAFTVADESAAKRIRIHHFMSNSAGLPPLAGIFGAMKRSIVDDPDYTDLLPPFDPAHMSKLPFIDTYEDLLSYLAASPIELLGEPGTQFSYSNDAFGLLGAIVERVSGMSYEAYVREYILHPAGMTHTAFFLDDLDKKTDISTLHTRKVVNGKPEVFASPCWWDAPSQRAAGFLKSTVRDMLRYTEIFRTGGCVGTNRILSKESVASMMTPQISIDSQTHYAYGLVVTPAPYYHGGTLVEHSGGLKGISAQMYILPDEGITGVALTNLDGAFVVRDLLASSLNSLHGRPLDLPELSYPSYEPESALFTDYCGKYASPEGNEIIVKTEEGTVKIVATLGELDSVIPLKAVGLDQFLMSMSATTSNPVRFIRDEQGQVSRILFGYRQLKKTSRSDV
ncbi:class A beta-lactamase-related serine hydrolase [Brevibacillus nitrificans]|uniref:Class A beta-lactamase-related serine hydrolase n=1 Tax=Brevibacillus nitrificans TaxID=651560 RepID=A0A3M8CY03_9BACL|nr:serine hydrolase [Brevibacillus nitrificans]RNB80319.1 class A beta-lactamase-related serine hydrolase [Brevibacillus nitrificans]